MKKTSSVSRRHRITTLVAGASTAVLLAGCAQSAPFPVPTQPSPSHSVTVATPTPGPPPTRPVETPTPSPEPDSDPDLQPCRAMAEGLSTSARLGQLLMMGVGPTLTPTEQTVLTRYRIGSVVLLGRHNQGVEATAALTGRLSDLASQAHLLVAADQEGGKVQRLTGPGFRTIPAAAKQATLALDSLQARARNWGRELAEAGVLLNLAPVADVVPAAKVKTNAPIGKLGRGYGSDPVIVSDLVRAVINGYFASGVGTSVKHFPGLGEVVGNTDHAAGVVDRVTTATSPALEPFWAAIEVGVPSVMVSSATYSRIDPKNQAVFSSKVIGLLRDAGFDKVVISDDLGAAASVKGIPAGARAVRFIKAGGDLVINASASLVAPMVKALQAEAKQDPEFAAQVLDATTRVLQLKQELGVLACE